MPKYKEELELLLLGLPSTPEPAWRDSLFAIFDGLQTAEQDTIWLAAEIVKVYDAARGGVPMPDSEAQEQARKWHEAFKLARTGGYACDLADDLRAKLSEGQSR